MSAKLKQELETQKGVHVRAIETIDAQLSEIDKKESKPTKAKSTD